MAGLAKGYNLILHSMAVVAGVLIFTAFVMIVIDVSMRIMGFSPPAFTIAIVEYILLYFTMLAAPWLVRIKGHVFIDAITQFFPPLIKMLAAKLVYTICIVSASIFCYYSFGLLVDAWVEGTLDVRGIDMPQWSLFLPIPVCFFFVAIEFGRFLIGLDDMYGDRTDVKEAM
jgi:C4-dicarboxylate transporter, DctQ subunit